MKKILIILSTICLSSIAPLSVISCNPNVEMNDDFFLPGDDIVNLKDCQNLFTKDDLTYSFLTVTETEVAVKVLSVLKYNIRDLTQADYSIAFQTKEGDPVSPINLVNDYNILLVAKENSKFLTGTLMLNLSVIDDRTDISQINYDENNWYLSSRNTVADLFKKFETKIYLAVQDASYSLGQFLKITIEHQDTVYTNEDEDSIEVLDVNGSYLISAVTEADNLANRYLVGSLNQLEIWPSDERQTVANLTNEIFTDYHPDNLFDSGKTLYQGIRNIINNLYTLDSTTQSDFEVMITSQGVKLNDDQSKLTSLSYEITIDATKSKYLKDSNSCLTIEINDKVIHLDQLKIDPTIFNPDVATQAKTLKTDLLYQIGVVASFPGVENYLIVNLSQNGIPITDDSQYLDPTNIEINVQADETIAMQYFGGILNLNLTVVDNRINLADETFATDLQNSILARGYSTLNTFGDVKGSILTIIKDLVKESQPNISQKISLDDLKITLDGYVNETDTLKESVDVTLKIQAGDNSRFIRNDLEPLNINVNFAKVKSKIEIIISDPKLIPIEFIDYDNNAFPHVMTQIEEKIVAIYEQDLTTIKYKIDYSTEKNAILDYKVSRDGNHDFWVMQTKIDDTHLKIDYYIDNQIICTNEFEAYAIIASINKDFHFLYVRPDFTQEHQGVGDLYQMSTNGKTIKVDLSQISPTPFAIEMIRSAGFSGTYIQSKNQVYLIGKKEKQNFIIKSYDISNDYFFDYDEDNNIYELKKEGLYLNNNLINPISPNHKFLYSVDNYKFISNLAVDQDNNFYYLYRDYVNSTYSLVKNQEVVFTITDSTNLYQYLKVSTTGIWELTVGSNIYTNEK